jgi:4-amino-4-deoxychorismate lyase
VSTTTSSPYRTLINGQDSVTVSAQDRGLLYGDGLFETLAVRNGAPLRWERHLQRLLLGCERLNIPCPDVTALTIESLALCKGHDRAVLKLIVTRGIGGRGYRAPAQAQATRILACHPWPEYPPEHARDGVCVRLCSTRLAGQPALAGLKHLNRLEQVLARAEWNDEEIAEGLLFDREDHVIEATMSNLFLVSAGQLVTPDLSDCGVAGIMRAMIIEVAATLGLSCRIRPVARTELFAADELLLCNSLIGLWPVRQLDTHRFVPGPVTRRLQHTLELHHD